MKSRLDRVEALRTEDEAKKRKEQKRTEQKSRTRPPSLLMPQGMPTWLLKGAAPWREGGTDNRVEITP